jgi:Kelch motif protein
MKTRSATILATIITSLIALASADALAQGTWATKASMPTARYLHSTSVVNGIIYRVGGTIDFNPNWPGTVDAYDPASDTWTTKASMNAYAAHCAWDQRC